MFCGVLFYLLIWKHEEFMFDLFEVKLVKWEKTQSQVLSEGNQILCIKD